GAVSTILTNLNTALQSPAAQQFFAWLAGAAEQDILGLTKAFGGFGVGILDIFQAFAPLETLVVNGLAGMGTAFADWASHLAASQGFQQFLAYVAQNGPLLTKTLGDIGLDVGKILAALTPLLPPLLQVVDFLTKVIGYGNVPDILVAIALGFTAIKLAATVGGWLETFGSSINDVVVKLGLMRAAEVTAGGTVDVAPAVTSLGTVGGAADAATLSVKGLLGALGTLTAAVFVVKIAMEIDSKQSNHVSAVPDKGFWGQLVNAGNVVPDWISSMLTPKKSAPGPTIGQAPTVDNPAWDLAVGIDSSAADLQNTFNSQVSGSPTSYFGNVGAAGGAPGGGTNNPPAYSIPNTATGAQNAAATAAANNAAGLAALLGLNLMQSLAQGITTGTNPLTQAFTNINQKLTGPAQTLGTALQTIFTNALALGQQAAQSLAFSVTSAPTVGSYTSVYMDAQGRSTTTTQSPLVGSAFNALITDQKFVADLQKAAAMGLAPSLRAQFVAAGPSSFPTLDALVNSGQGAVSTLNSENAAITALGNSYGLQVAQQQFGPQTLTTLQQIRDQQAQLPAAIGTSVAAALNHTGATAKVAAANTANKGVFARAQ
ncbi:MAG TPA: hypothetical protein VIJ31_12215, partial [Acidothermaceae bacterium]